MYIAVHTSTFAWMLIYVWTQYSHVCTASQPHFKFIFHEARSLAALRRRLVSALSPRRSPWAAPWSLLLSSLHQSFQVQLTDHWHPGVACLTQTVTVTGLPPSHTHCCQAGHPLLQCHRLTAAHLEARPLVLAVLVRNGRGQVTSQEQGDQWNSVHHIGCWNHIQGITGRVLARAHTTWSLWP